MSTWQPIETAPRDSSIFIVTDGSFSSPASYVAGRWRFWDETCVDETSGNVTGILNFWIAPHGPTHWMPLPAPPEATP
jgi:hypothetical protein